MNLTKEEARVAYDTVMEFHSHSPNMTKEEADRFGYALLALRVGTDDVWKSSSFNEFWEKFGKK